MSEGTDHHALAWLNSMRLDLMALGLERRARDVTPTSLADIIKRHRQEAAERVDADLAADVAVNDPSRAGDAFAPHTEAAE